MSWRALDPVTVGRFVAYPHAFHYQDAREWCQNKHPGGDLASIHSAEEQQQAADACRPVSGGLSEAGRPGGCWIGLTDAEGLEGVRTQEGTFVWTDGSPVDYQNWAPGVSIHRELCALCANACLLLLRRDRFARSSLIGLVPQEPNDWGNTVGQGQGSVEGEDASAMDFFSFGRDDVNGLWNDMHVHVKQRRFLDLPWFLPRQP